MVSDLSDLYPFYAHDLIRLSVGVNRIAPRVGQLKIW